MPRFFITPPLGEMVTLVGEDAKHISRSLRMKEGEELTLSDEQGWDYKGKISQLTGETVQVKLIERFPNETEPTVELTLYQALPKGDKLDFIVQKAVELGVSRIVPVLTRYCISRPKETAMERKRERLEKIALEAAKQSERGKIPTVDKLLPFSQALEELEQQDLGLLFYEKATQPLREVLTFSPKNIGVMVGSEGGFSPEEAEEAQEKGIPLVSLGNRILRCETAPICGISAILYATGEL